VDRAVLYTIGFFTGGTYRPDLVARLVHGYRHLLDRLVLAEGILTVGFHTSPSFIVTEVGVSTLPN
jgi:hypothetical protein